MCPHIEKEAWVEKILQEHQELRASIGRARDFLLQPRPHPHEKHAESWASRLFEQLEELQEGLRRHFEAEERGDEYENLGRRYPRAFERAGRLRSEHRELLTSMQGLLDRVAEYARGGTIEDPRLRRGLAEVLQKIDAHEKAETELMQRMIYNELGGHG